MRLFTMLYGAFCYIAFFVVFVYFMGFVGDVFVPISISSEVDVYSENALLVNISLMLLWGIQHSVMARSWFKDMIASVVPHHVERSTYCLVSAIVLAILMYYWQPMAGLVWQVENPVIVKVLWGLFVVGWVLVLMATFLTNHFDLFGLRQSWLYFCQKNLYPGCLYRNFVLSLDPAPHDDRVINCLLGPTHDDSGSLSLFHRNVGLRADRDSF